ncbi:MULTISPECIES: hypothetical protein [unclassified Novosphingobium]|uniref:hypothetical protein n=1 Tax=unclassified Novosphingobium TaxID=2644732 RepID=UPI000EBA4839|nr:MULTISPECIES: hypothetical protein [unclassified Novosphingobium]HCF24352.1 hypothetical protein [Novosphingobium sp.]HQV02625.1 hypothetical protein [Novosphingobium sp.]
MRPLGSIALAASIALALTACGKKEEAPVAEASETAASTDAAAAQTTTITPGTFEVFDAAGKKQLTSTINADGTYADDLVNGQRIAGIVKVVDGKLCFDPSGKAPQECYTESARAADGSFTATDEKGTVLTVKPVAK